MQEQLKASFKAQVDAATEKRIKPLTDENEALKSKNMAFTKKLNLAQVYNETAESDKARLKREIDRKNQLLLGIGEMLYKTSELIRKAIDALISFAQRVLPLNMGLTPMQTIHAWMKPRLLRKPSASTPKVKPPMLWVNG